jgi:hypothetical protein
MSNIKVYLRIRPELKDDGIRTVVGEDEEGKKVEKIIKEDLTAFDFSIKESSKKTKQFILNCQKKYFNEKKFNFENIFEGDKSQEELYLSFKEKLVESTLSGVI